MEVPGSPGCRRVGRCSFGVNCDVHRGIHRTQLISPFVKKYENLTRWYLEISERDAVKKGFGFMNKEELPPKP